MWFLIYVLYRPTDTLISILPAHWSKLHYKEAKNKHMNMHTTFN